MQRICAAVLLMVGIGGMAVAQKTDVLGPHANYGRGCAACHIPHGGRAAGRTGRKAQPLPVPAMLWGEETIGLPVTPNPAGPDPEQTGMLICLSCHDGNYAPAAMIKGEAYESIPGAYGAVHRTPTLLDQPSVSTGADIEQHPVGKGARIGCGGAGWDCKLTKDGVDMAGKRSSRFANTYGFFVKPRRDGDSAVVVCTSCHNPHLMNVVNVSRHSASALYPEGNHATRHFLRAPYGAEGSPQAGNQSAQFCRQCHADKSNEMNGNKAE